MDSVAWETFTDWQTGWALLHSQAILLYHIISNITQLCLQKKLMQKEAFVALPHPPMTPTEGLLPAPSCYYETKREPLYCCMREQLMMEESTASLPQGQTSSFISGYQKQNRPEPICKKAKSKPLTLIWRKQPCGFCWPNSISVVPQTLTREL